MPLPASLDPELLYCFVLGPGYGETVLLRVPPDGNQPDQWIVIDSFLCDDRPAAESVVARYEGTVSCIVLTHPHGDHYPGIIGLIDENPGAKLGCVHPSASPPDPAFPDPVAVLKQQARPAYVRIWDEWEANTGRRWETFRREVYDFPGRKLTSLHPVRPLPLGAWGSDPNEMSSAMLVEWHAVRLLLGADVPDTQWPGICSDFQRLEEHAALKVPHHGSPGAIHDVFARGSSARRWVVTPWKLGGNRLPKADPGHGLEMLLSYAHFPHPCV